MIYLASPYSDSDPEIQSGRADAAALATGILLKQGRMVFSPICHCKPIAEIVNLPHDFEFWQRYNESMIEICSSLLVLTINGWERSKGVAAEIEYAKRIGYEVNYISIEELLDVHSSNH